MVSPGGRRRDDDLGPVTDRTGRVQGRTVTASSRSLRGRHSTSNIPSIPTPFAIGFHYDIGAPGSSTQPPLIPIRSRPPLPLHLSHTPLPYDVYGSSQPPSHPIPALYDSYVHAPSVRSHIPYRSKAQEPLNEFSGGVPPDSSYNTHDYTTTDYGVSSSEPFIGRDSGVMGLEGERGLDEEPDKLRSLHIGGEDDERVHDDGDNAGDEEQPVPLTPVTLASSSGGRPHHGKGKGLTGSFMLGDLLGVLRRLSIFTRTLVRSHVLMQRSWLDASHYLSSGCRQCIPAYPIRPMEACRPANNRMYVVRNIFVEALWLEALSHLLTETWTSILTILPSACTNDYMQWFLTRSYPRIQNPMNVLHQLSWT
ncbi:hypothetical protein M9H77_14326 [Catharanthus roseus]|uniref:Uncharacterized protein n=1 Tax=Catharanthus roseus TaxID=4058 RepID=A0ACC0BN01_CATRO|nr:hypothetical protein M9H77_14326 [Catharanthus roseus]